jgi:hypothetical protein
VNKFREAALRPFQFTKAFPIFSGRTVVSATLPMGEEWQSDEEKQSLAFIIPLHLVRE